METNDISWLNLILGSLILILPVWIFYFYKTKLVKSIVIAFLRMAVQLFLVGLYLSYIFELNSFWLNSVWLVIMVVAACFTVIKRSDLNYRYFLIPVAIGVLANVIVNIVIFAFIVIGKDHFFNARYLIPITGMIIGNCLNSAVIGTSSFYKSLVKDEERYRYYLISGATRNEALFPFFSDALKAAFNPTIASTATIGLIWLPGMMTGQILGGSNPMTAIKYQILIIFAIFAGGVFTVFLSLFFSEKFAFDSFDNLNRKAYLADKLKK